tara:strand:- start:6 stop:809 length:804 start_codon:yes stop_codon:yes gene_type:complete
MKNNLKFLQIFFISLLCTACNIDEIPPEIPNDTRGWFTIEANNIGVNLNWSYVEDEDIDKYIILKSIAGSEAQEIGETEDNYFKDSDVEWLKYYQYYIQSVDKIGNKSEFSDSILVRIYSASGNWELNNFDSTYMCIDHNQIISTSSGTINQKGYFLSDGYELVLSDLSNDSTYSVGDTIVSKMLFSSCNVDSSTWDGNGWMTYQTTVLDTTINGDTLETTSNNFPVYFNLDLLDPQSGSITFSSPLFESISIQHSLQFCNGNAIFD